jgi:hypothetical protein
MVERMPRVCKAVIKEKGGYFEESKIENICLFNIFLVTTCGIYMWYLIVLMSSLLFYNVETSKNKEKPLNE